MHCAANKLLVRIRKMTANWRDRIAKSSGVEVQMDVMGEWGNCLKGNVFKACLKESVPFQTPRASQIAPSVKQNNRHNSRQGDPLATLNV
jgi:hypothetical protein